METPIQKHDHDGEFIEDHYIVGQEEVYPVVTKSKNKVKKTQSPPKPSPKKFSGFVDEKGNPVDDDGDWVDDDGEGVATDDGEFEVKSLHDSSAESLEKFILEHTLQLNIDAETGDISLENSMPNSQQTSSSSQSTPTQRSPPSHRSSPSVRSPRLGNSPPLRRAVATRESPLRASSLPPLTITFSNSPTPEATSVSQHGSPSQEDAPPATTTLSEHTTPGQTSTDQEYTSPDTAAFTPPARTPTSPEDLFLHTPVGHIKVLDWGAEVDRFLDGSQGSSPAKSVQNVSDTSMDISLHSEPTETPTKRHPNGGWCETAG